MSWRKVLIFMGSPRNEGEVRSNNELMERAYNLGKELGS
jgi:hypothetical protein